MTKKILSIVLLLMLVTVMTASAASVTIMKVSTGVRMRTAPNNSAGVIRTLRAGEFVFCDGKNYNGFYRICTATGSVGYVYGSYLRYHATVKSSQVYVLSSGASVYRKPSTNASRIVKTSGKSLVIVGAVSHGWAIIKNGQGSVGYTPVRYLTKAR